MDAKEVKILVRRITRVTRKLKKEDRDGALYQMSRTQGWQHLRNTMEEMIYELLEPVEFEPYTPAEIRLAITESRKLTLEMLRKLLSEISTVVNATKIIEENKQKEKEASAKGEE